MGRVRAGLGLVYGISTARRLYIQPCTSTTLATSPCYALYATSWRKDDDGRNTAIGRTSVPLPRQRCLLCAAGVYSSQCFRNLGIAKRRSPRGLIALAALVRSAVYISAREEARRPQATTPSAPPPDSSRSTAATSFTMFASASRAISTLAVLAAVATPALADFHIFNGANGSGGFAAKTVPSNQYSCSGWQNAPVIDGVPDVDPGVSFFDVRNLCGVAQLNFYNNGNGFDVYINNGDGSKIGTCGPGNGGSINGNSACPDGYAVFDEYICLTYVCS